MIVYVVTLAALFATACGADTKPNAASTSRRVSEPDDPEPAPKKKRKKPKQWYAKAALTPVKGTRIKPAIVSFSQREDEETSVESDALDGAKAGTYWLVVHEGDSCGPNATKSGAAWPGGAGAKMRIVVDKDGTAELDARVVPFDLVGDDGAVGHVLVLHEDKKGKPGKALACGAIEEVEEP